MQPCHRSTSFPCIATLFLALSSAQIVFARDAAPARPVSFRNDLAPLLVSRCEACHGPKKAKGKYRLDTFAAFMKPGASDAAPVSAGQPDKSELYKLVCSADDDERMPKKDEPLTREQIALIERWIREGATFDGPDPKASLASLAADVPYPDPPAVYPAPVPAMAVAFSPNGKELAVGGYHEVTFWDAGDGHLLRRVKGVPQRTECLAWLPDGAHVAAACGTPGKVGEVRLIDPAGTSPPRLLDRIGDLMNAVAFSPDGTRLAAGGADNAIRVYDAATGHRDLLIEQHADWVMALAFSPDGSRLASASRDKSSRVFDAKTGAMDQVYAGHEEPVLAVAWSADGKQIYTAGRDKLIHARSSAGEGKKITEMTPFTADVLRLVDASGYLFACGADRTVRQISEDGKSVVRTWADHSDWVLGLSVDAKNGHIATGSFNGEVRVYAIEDGRLLLRFIAAPGWTGAITPEHKQ